MQQAYGGEHWDRIGSLHFTTTITSGGESVRSERWEDVATGRYLVRTRRPTYLSQSGFDGITSWRQSRSGVAYSLGDLDSTLVAADESFRVSRGWWFSDRHPATIAQIGVRSDRGRSFDILEVTPEGGRRFEAWIDRATHLLARTDEQQAEDRVVTTYSDYRSVQGVMIPFALRSGDGSDPAFDEVETVDAVDVNRAIPDDLYAIPPRPPIDLTFPPHRDRIEVPFRLTTDNRILVPLTIAGKKVEAEFDSGGSLILQPQLARELGFTTQGKSKQSGGGEGSTTSTEGRLDAVALGDVVVHGLAFHSFAFDADEPDRALVGLEILQRFVIRFDFDRGVMTLSIPDTFSYTGPGAVIPFHIQDNQPEIKGSIDGVAGLFTIDTGDNGSLLLIAPFARRYGLVAKYHADLPYEGGAIGTTHGVWARRRVGTVFFDGADGRPAARVHEPVTRISLQRSGFDAHPYVSANIGLGILKQFNLTFDYVRKQIILEPNRLYGRRDVFNRTGLRLKRQGSSWAVTAVYAGSAAEGAGIRPGDVVERVDGRSADELRRDELATKLTGPIGARLDVLLRSGNAERQVTLTLKDIL